MKLVYIMLIVLFSTLLLSCSKNVTLVIGTSTANSGNLKFNSGEKAIPLSLPLNSSIKNAKAYIDDGLLVFEFDFPSQTWLKLGDQFSGPRRFFIRLFDENKNLLSYFSSDKKYFPFAAYEKTMIDKKLVPSMWKWPTKSPDQIEWLIHQSGNQLSFPLNKQILDYTEYVEFGFFDDNKVISEKNIWHPM